MKDIFLTETEMQYILEGMHKEIEWWQNHRLDYLENVYQAADPKEKEDDINSFSECTDIVHKYEDIIEKIFCAIID